MKRIIFIWAVFLISIDAYCQDLIILLKGDTLNVTITKNASDLVEYKFPNETLVNSENKRKIYKILFGSGRVEVCNEKIKLPIIKGDDDWENVLITFNESDIIGLTEVKEIVGKSGLGGFASVRGGENAKKELRKKAAGLGASIVLVIGGWDKEKSKPISGYGRGVKLTGKAFK